MVNTLPSNAQCTGSIPGQGAKVPHALQPKNQSIKNNRSNIVTNSLKPLKKKEALWNLTQKIKVKKRKGESTSQGWQWVLGLRPMAFALTEPTQNPAFLPTPSPLPGCPENFLNIMEKLRTATSFFWHPPTLPGLMATCQIGVNIIWVSHSVQKSSLAPLSCLDLGPRPCWGPGSRQCEGCLIPSWGFTPTQVLLDCA